MSERLPRRGTVLGSAYYLSPEQAQASDSVDLRADLYSAGALLFEMLAGRPPHVAPTLESVLVAICTQVAPDVRAFRPDVPATTAAAIARALEREPDGSLRERRGVLREHSQQARAESRRFPRDARTRARWSPGSWRRSSGSP